MKIDHFHWAETPWKIKSVFVEKSLSFDFKVKVAVVKNPVNPNKEILRILPHLIIEKNINLIVIDGKKPKWYERTFRNVLRQKGVSTRMLRMVKSEKEPIIRLADMLAGLVRSYFDGYKMENVERFYKRLEKKIEILIQ